MTPEDWAEYHAEPSPEWEEEQAGKLRHDAALIDFGYLVPSPVADRQEKWLKHEKDLSKGALSRNADEKEAHRRYRKKCLKLMAESQQPLRSVTQVGRARWYHEHTDWPTEWRDDPRQSAKVPSEDTIKRRMLPTLARYLRRHSLSSI
jgi:hypothetical protein